MASESFRQFKEWLEAGKTMADQLETKKVKVTIHRGIYINLKENASAHTWQRYFILAFKEKKKRK